jgi:uncharacterized membrane protein
MTLKEFQKVRIVIVVAISVVFSQALVYKNFLVPVAVLIVGSLVLLRARRSVKETIADERDYAMAGKAALLAIQIYSWMAVIAMFFFYSLRDVNPAYEAIGMTLAYSTMVLMLANAVIFRYYDRFSLTDKKLLYTLFMLVLFGALFIVGARGLTGEDDWICDNGQWVSHGHPSYPAPGTECK